MIVVCDSTILIGLAKIGRLDLLREVFSKISVPEEVFHEVVEGEAEVLTLAKQLGADLILVDEQKARKSAVIAGYDVMGLLGLFILAKKLGLIDQIRPLIGELRKKKFRVSDRVVLETLKRAGE